jgi:methyltransferase (TIGR00027 family)
MTGESIAHPDSTAVRVALWRALHVEVDAPPHVIEDEIGLQIADPEDGWRERPDMDPQGTSMFRAGIVARARFVEDLVVERAGQGVTQYVILGAGLDTFAQRRPDAASGIHVFEIDQPGPQAWKERRLADMGFDVPEWLRFVPVDFEAGEQWSERLIAAGFDAARPAVVASTGVSMYLTKEANTATMREVASFARGSTFVSTFLLPVELMDEDDRVGFGFAERGAAASGTPFISFYAPDEMTAAALEAGFARAEHVSAAALNERFFAGRPDGLRTSSGEDIVVAST